MVYKRLRGGPPPYESLNKSAMSCCSFEGICCMNSARMQFLVSCYNGKVFGAESETSCLNANGYNRSTDLPLAAKKKHQTEVINKIPFQIIGA